MGIARGTASLLLTEAEQRPFSGGVATLGRQHIHFDFDRLNQMAASARVSLQSTEVRLHREPALAARGFISDETFLHAIGFDSVSRLDVNDYEAPDEIIDLNAAETPVHLCEMFDVVMDIGTSEHVFHLPNVLAHLHRMTRPGGRIIHCSPSSNHLDHGFHMFSPTLFWDYYSANGYQLLTFKIARYTHRTTYTVWDVYEYRPELVQSEVRWGGLDNAMYDLFVVALKQPGAKCDAIPQQGWYLDRWEESAGEVIGRENGKAKRLLDLTAGSPRLTQLARRVIHGWRAKVKWLRTLRSGPRLPKAGRTW